MSPWLYPGLMIKTEGREKQNISEPETKELWRRRKPQKTRSPSV